MNLKAGEGEHFFSIAGALIFMEFSRRLHEVMFFFCKNKLRLKEFFNCENRLKVIVCLYRMFFKRFTAS